MQEAKTLSVAKFCQLLISMIKGDANRSATKTNKASAKKTKRKDDEDDLEGMNLLDPNSIEGLKEFIQSQQDFVCVESFPRPNLAGGEVVTAR